MKTSEFLRNMIDLLATPSNWIQGNFARDHTGSPCSPKDVAACSFCVLGAFQAVTARMNAEQRRLYYWSRGPRAITYLEQAALERGYNDLVVFNDHRTTTHAGLLDALKLAHAKALADEGRPLLLTYEQSTKPELSMSMFASVTDYQAALNTVRLPQ
jgi:hypothetical protein